MGADTKIQWCHHTFNPWRGCTKVSDGCKNCYADQLSKRNPKTLGVWGPQGQRVVAAESYWRQPIKWNREAEQAGERRRVFCASLADVFEGPETMPAASVPIVEAARQRLWQLIDDTTWLDWLLLTKRPENVMAMLPNPRIGSSTIYRPNIWLGTSVEDQKAADERIRHLLKCPAAVRFLSCEPLLGPIRLILKSIKINEAATWGGDNTSAVNWVIVGGESGPNARPCRPAWIRSIMHQCRKGGAACFVKQMGSRIEIRNDEAGDWGRGGDVLTFEETPDTCQYQGKLEIARLEDAKGGDPGEWPDDLRVRELPEVAGV